MIYTDKELQSKFNRIHACIRQKRRDVQFKKILCYISPLCELLIFFLALSELSRCIENIDIVTLIILLLVSIMFLNLFYLEKYLLKNIKVLERKINLHKKEIERLKDFIAYLTAYRHLESLKNGNNLYPELREDDSKYIVKQYKNIFEEKRIKYEKQHKKD